VGLHKHGSGSTEASHFLIVWKSTQELENQNVFGASELHTLADDGELNTVYNMIPTTTVATELKMEGLTNWQRQWESTDKGALCRSFFPTVEQRLKLKIPITSELTAIVSGHGNTKSYLHRFKLIDNPMCPCNDEAQISEHLIYDCKIPEAQRKTLKHQ
jgi:hypothetical protein